MNEQLLAYLFDYKPHPLAISMSQWVNSSRRFQRFATNYRDKIRKKIRITQHDSAIKDLGVELAVAYQLVQQKRFTVTYEAYGSKKTRGPDFSVKFKSLTFNVEVTRIDSSNMKLSGTPPALEAEQVNGRLMDTVCDKLGQMRPGMVNVLYIVTGSDSFNVLDLDDALAQLKAQAERKDESLLSRYDFVNTAGFFKFYLRLSAVVVRPDSRLESTFPPALWLNNQAKQPLPTPLRTILQQG